MKNEGNSLFNIEEMAHSNIAAELFPVLLRNHIKLYRHPDGLYRNLAENCERFAEHFGLDGGEIRAVINGRAQPSERLLMHFGLAPVLISRECTECGTELKRLVYKSL